MGALKLMSLPVMASVFVMSSGLPAVAATGGKCRAGASCFVDGDGAYIGFTKPQTAGLPKKVEAKVTVGKKKVTKLVPYEYQVVLACPANNSPDKNEVGCEKAFKTCLSVKDAEGPLKFIFRRPMVQEKDRTAWTNIGQTCWPKLVPGAKSKPELTVAMIRSAFAKTPFVRPRATMEPVGNRTLVNLPNFFTADFSGAGYGPDEVRTVTLLGHQVRIKPVLKSNTFHFGDGASLGPTESRGGGYPDGDVRHTYAQRGTVNASVTTVYGGQFSVDGGPFTDLPGTATITGPAQPIQVLEATGRLVR